MLIREATPGDSLAVAQVHVRAWQVAYRGLLPDGYLDELRAEDRAPRYTFGDVDPQRPATTVAVDGGVICGFATTGPARAETGAGELLALYVDPDRWGRGIGRALVRTARERLLQQGYGNAVLWVLDGNARATRFYATDGWALDGARRTERLWGIEATDVRYRRALP